MKFNVKEIVSRIDFNKLKNYLIIGFCILTAVMNIIRICGSKKDSVVYFSDEQPSLSVFQQDIQSINYGESAEKNIETETVAEAENISSKININKADKSELMSLKGIGEAKASAIIEYRNEYGSFVSTEEIMLVRGIGEKIYSNIKDSICTE